MVLAAWKEPCRSKGLEAVLGQRLTLAHPLPSADVGSVEGLAYHRGWDTLYWTSYTTSTITRHTVDQSRLGAFERETVITMSGDDHPRAFVLDECQK